MIWLLIIMGAQVAAAVGISGGTAIAIHEAQRDGGNRRFARTAMFMSLLGLVGIVVLFVFAMAGVAGR